ncbi:MAG TPA: sigma-70 family RNA polymerase sigma factor [Bryobacteraceae bacterium]
MSAPGDNVTLLLAQLREGNREAASQLIPLIYNEMRRMAGAYMQRERPGHTLQATALVHEAYMRLAGGQPGPWQNRAHFFAVAAHVMRQVLVDHARRRHSGKRGGGNAQKVDIDAEVLIGAENTEDVIALDEALDRLAKLDPRQSRLVELRFFAGLDVEQLAEVMDVSPTTIKREWRSAKAWLHGELTLLKSR